jgi:hypothetical protein
MRRFPPERIVCVTEETVESLYFGGVVLLSGDRHVTAGEVHQVATGIVRRRTLRWDEINGRIRGGFGRNIREVGAGGAC